jgi:hypothetical protein
MPVTVCSTLMSPAGGPSIHLVRTGIASSMSTWELGLHCRHRDDTAMCPATCCHFVVYDEVLGK